MKASEAEWRYDTRKLYCREVHLTDHGTFDGW